MKHLIDKSVLMAEIEKRIKGLRDCHADTVAGYAGEISGLERLLSFINTLEVKEVDSTDALIEKACNLLGRMIWEVTYEDLEGDSTQHYDKMEFIEDFRNYMKKNV